MVGISGAGKDMNTDFRAREKLYHPYIPGDLVLQTLASNYWTPVKSLSLMI